MTTKPITWNAKTSRLYGSLKRRGGVRFTLQRFRAWLTCEAINAVEPEKGLLLWKCPFGGQVLTLADVSVDHKDPLALGGPGALDNLTVCAERWNRIKGKIPYWQFVKLKRTVDEEWPIEAAKDLWERLAARPIYRRKL